MKGPLFHYGGPFHFKPPFTIGGKERSTGGTVAPGSTSPGHAVGGGHVANAPAPPAPQPTAIVRVAPATATAPRSAPSSALWLLIPAALLAIGAVAAVVFEPKNDRRATVTESGS